MIFVKRNLILQFSELTIGISVISDRFPHPIRWFLEFLCEFEMACFFKRIYGMEAVTHKAMH